MEIRVIGTGHRCWFVFVLVLLQNVFAPSASAEQPEGRFPFRSGQRLDGGWGVSLARRHPEFIRLVLSRRGMKTCLEIRYHKKSDPDIWSSRHYRVQPCPGYKSNLVLVKSMVERLRRMEQEPGHKKLVVKISVKENPYELKIFPWLNLAVFICFILLLVVFFIRLPEHRIPVASCLGLSAVTVVLVILLLDPKAIPPGLVTVLQEGLDAKNIMQLYGKGVHAGPNYKMLIETIAGRGVIPLRTMIHANICLALINVIMGAGAVWAFWRKAAPGAVFAILMTANIGFVHSLFSELPGQLVFTYFLMGMVPWALLCSRDIIGWTVGILCVVFLGVLTVCLFYTRYELVLLGLFACAAGTLKLFRLEPVVKRWALSFWSCCKEAWIHALVILLLVVVSSTYVWLKWQPSSELRYAVDGLFPFNPSFLTLPYEFFHFLSAGVILLVVLGLVFMFRNILLFAFFPLSFLLIYRVHYSSSHGWPGEYYERFRYLVMMTPFIFFTAIMGFKEVAAVKKRIEDRIGKKGFRIKAALVGFVLLFCIWRPLGSDYRFGPGQALPGIGRHRFLLSRNQQTDMRFIILLMDRHPRCAFVTRILRHMGGPHYKHWWVFYGGSAGSFMIQPDKNETLDQIVEQLVPHEPCVIYYRGLDCNRRASKDCTLDIKGRALIQKVDLENLPYSEVPETGRIGPRLELGAYRVKDGPSGH